MDPQKNKEDTVRKSLKPKVDTLERAFKILNQILKKKRTEVKARKKSEKNLVKRKSKRLKNQEPKPIRKGIVYIGHIPHGFYEEQMKKYFKQFGKVTRIRVARSKRTGKSRGYGYIEFLHPEVAQVAAESMNNYLMCGRLLKATYIPPEKQHVGFFSGVNWSEDKYPKLRIRRRAVIRKNRDEKPEHYEKYVKKSLNKLSMLESKLQDKGISIKFQPVDVPSTET